MPNHLKRKVSFLSIYTVKVEQKVAIISTALASGGSFPPILAVVLLYTNKHIKESNLEWRIS